MSDWLSEKKSKVVLGLGNLLCRDDGFGVHALHALRTSADSFVEFEFVDGGVLGMNLLPLVETCSHLLVLDAIDAGLAPGTVIETENDQISLYHTVKLSEHQVSFQEVLGLARFRDQLPAYLHVIGVQPEDLSWGIGLSPCVTAAIADVTLRAMGVLKTWAIPTISSKVPEQDQSHPGDNSVGGGDPRFWV